MSDDEIIIWLQDLKQDLKDFIIWSSKRRMRGEIDLWSFAGPLLCADYLSEGEYHMLFLRGFHPTDRAKLTPDSEQQFQDIVRMMKNAVDDLSAPQTPLPPAHAPLPPAPETLTSPTDFVTSAPAAPVDPSHAPPPASDLVARARREPVITTLRTVSPSPSS